MLAFAMLAVVRRPRQHAHVTPKKPTTKPGRALIRWSVQEIRRIATRLAQRRIEPAFVIAWSAWRRAHQAAAQALTSANAKCNCNARLRLEGGFSARWILLRDGRCATSSG